VRSGCVVGVSGACAAGGRGGGGGGGCGGGGGGGGGGVDQCVHGFGLKVLCVPK